MRIAAFGWLLACAGACATGWRIAAVSPDPFAGPAPHSIAVWPEVGAAAGPHGPALLAELDRSVRARGYRVPSLAMTQQRLVDAQLHGTSPGDGQLAAVGQALEVDAILVLDVRRFEAGDEPLRRAQWDLGWRILSTRGLGVLWGHDHVGSWDRRDLVDEDPLRRLDAEPEVVPIGGDRAPDFRSVRELAANLHRLAMDHLPAGRR